MSTTHANLTRLAVALHGPTARIHFDPCPGADECRADLCISWGEADEYGQPFGDVLASDVLDSPASVERAYAEAHRALSALLAAKTEAA